MEDDNLPPMHDFDRLSIPAVLIPEGHDSRSNVDAAGILDPVVIPVLIDGDGSEGMGDWMTPNLTVIFEPDHEDLDEFDDPSAERQEATMMPADSEEDAAD